MVKSKLIYIASELRRLLGECKLIKIILKLFLLCIKLPQNFIELEISVRIRAYIDLLWRKVK